MDANISSVEWQTPLPVAVGPRMDFVASFSRLVAPFMAAAVRRANRADLASLRSLLEQR